MQKQFHSRARVIASAFFVLVFCQGSHAQDASASLAKPYVTVNGQAQSNARAEVLLREQLARGAGDSAELRQAVREALINQALISQEARKAAHCAVPVPSAPEARGWHRVWLCALPV